MRKQATLKELCYEYSEDDLLCDPKDQHAADCLVTIFDEFAIGFGQWMTSGVEFVDDTERGRVYYFKKKLYTTKELLEMYKTEKGL